MSRRGTIERHAARRHPGAILLDLDKTLVNAEDAIDYCAALADLRAVVPGLLAEAPAQTSWNRCTGPVIALLGAASGTDDWPLATDVVERHELRGVDGSTAMPGLADFAAHLDHARTAIVTLLGPAAAAAIARRHLGEPLPVVVGRGAGMRPKPAPDQLLEALRQLGCSPGDAVFLGDSEVDEAAARAAGVAFVGVTNGRKRHGFAATARVAPDLAGAALHLFGPA